MGLLDSISSGFSDLGSDLGEGVGVFNAGFNPASMALAVPGLQFLGQQQQNSANWSAMNTEMGIQEQMASTGYQRSVADMTKAGLNPVLAATNGPEGGNVSPVNPGFGSPLSALGGGINSAVGSLTSLASTMSQIGLNSAQKAKVQADTDYTNAQTVKTGVDTEASRAGLAGKANDELINKIIGSAMRAVIGFGTTSAKKAGALIPNTGNTPDNLGFGGPSQPTVYGDVGL